MYQPRLEDCEPHELCVVLWHLTKFLLLVSFTQFRGFDYNARTVYSNSIYLLTLYRRDTVRSTSGDTIKYFWFPAFARSCKEFITSMQESIVLTAEEQMFVEQQLCLFRKQQTWRQTPYQPNRTSQWIQQQQAQSLTLPYKTCQWTRQQQAWSLY